MAPEEKLKTYRILQIYGTIKFVGQMPPDKYINFPLMVIIMLIFVFTQYIKNASVYQETCDEFQNTLSSLTKSLERSRSHPTRNHENIDGTMDVTGYQVGNRIDLNEG